MTDRRSLDDEQRLNRLKLEALAEFSAGAGHEINNPIATIIGYAQQLLVGESDPDRRHALATIGAQAYRVRDMIGDCMLFARPPQPRSESIDLAVATKEVVTKLQQEAEWKGITIRTAQVVSTRIWADTIQLKVALSSFLRNSIEALSPGGEITMECRPEVIDDRNWGIFVISDNGPGLAEADREHLFDPFYSGRQAGRGLGFGLPKAWRIITQHGGKIEVADAQTTGVCITVYWPTEAGR